MGNWESVFNRNGKFFYEPHEDMESLVELLRKNNAKKVLDLGCGSGRHSVFLAKAGFDVYGMDNSKSGLKQTKEWLRSLSLQAKLKNADCYKKFPYNTPKTKEALYFRNLFHKHFPGRDAIIPYSWLPKWTPTNTNEPSARCLE